MTFTICTREKELGQTIFIPLGSRTFSEIYQVSTREVPKDWKMESLKKGGWGTWGRDPENCRAVDFNSQKDSGTNS